MIVHEAWCFVGFLDLHNLVFSGIAAWSALGWALGTSCA